MPDYQAHLRLYCLSRYRNADFALNMQDIADRATVTRLTVSKVEHGDPTVFMGIYARVLFALNLENDITLLAADDALGRQLQDAELLRK